MNYIYSLLILLLATVSCEVGIQAGRNEVSAKIPSITEYSYRAGLTDGARSAPLNCPKPVRPNWKDLFKES